METCMYVLDQIAIDDDINPEQTIKFLKTCIDYGIDINQYAHKLLLGSIRVNQMEVINFLIANGIDIRTNNDDALVTACESNNYDAVKLLISLGVDVATQNNICMEKLYVKGNRSLDILKLLVENGADPFVDSNILLCTACNEYNIDIVEYLISIGVDCSKPKNILGISEKGNPEILRLLLANGMDPNELTDNYYHKNLPVLEFAVYFCNYDYCKVLLEFNADFNLCKNLVNKNYAYMKNGGNHWRSLKEINRLEQIVELFAGYGYDIRGICDIFK